MAPSSPVNGEAIEAIGLLNHPWTDEALAGFVKKSEDGEFEDMELAGAALLAMARRGAPDLLPDLEQLIVESDEDWDVDGLVVRALSEIPGPKSLALLHLLATREDADEDVLMLVIAALAKHGTEDAVDTIKSMLDHEDDDVKATAAGVLLRFGDTDAERMVDAFLADPEASDWDEDILAAALGVKDSVTAIPVLIGLAKSEFWDTRQLALRSLGRTRLPAARAALTEALGDEDDDVKATAAAALLREFEDAAGVAALVATVKNSKDYEALTESIRALSALARPVDHDAFQAAFDKKFVKIEWLFVKVWAAHALLMTP